MSYIINDYLRTVDFSVLEQNKEIVYPECDDEIHSIAMNPTAGKVIKVNYKYFTEDEDERRALASGLCLNCVQNNKPVHL